MKQLEERLTAAARGGPAEIKLLLHDPSEEVLAALLRNPFFTEDHLLALLRRKDLSREFLETLAARDQWMAGLAVKASVAKHPRTPRLVALKLLKFLYLFDLVAVSLEPAVAGEIKRQAENLIIARLAELPLGQQMTLARRGPARVAAELLQLGNGPVVPLALENPFLTEAGVVRVLQFEELEGDVVEQIARHPKWSVRYDVRFQLVRNPKTPVELLRALVPELKAGDLKYIARERRLSEARRDFVRAEVERREERRGA